MVQALQLQDLFWVDWFLFLLVLKKPYCFIHSEKKNPQGVCTGKSGGPWQVAAVPWSWTEGCALYPIVQIAHKPLIYSVLIHKILIPPAHQFTPPSALVFLISCYLLGFHSTANKKKSVSFVCLILPSKRPNKEKNLSSLRKRLWGTLGLLWVGLVVSSVRCEQERGCKGIMCSIGPCTQWGGEKEKKKQRREQAMVPISKLWSRITVAPFLFALAGLLQSETQTLWQ